METVYCSSCEGENPASANFCMMCGHPLSVVGHKIVSKLEQGHYPGISTVNVALPRRGNSLGIAAMVLGIVAFPTCWIPILNIFLSLPLSILGFVLAAIGLVAAFTRKCSNIGFPIAGIILCGLSLLISVPVLEATSKGFQSLREVRDTQIHSTPKSTGSVNPPESEPEAPAKTDPIGEISDIGVSVLTRGDVIVQYAWKSTINNNSSNAIKVHVTLTLYDKDGFPLEKADEYNVVVPSYGKKVVTGQGIAATEVFNRVTSYAVGAERN